MSLVLSEPLDKSRAYSPGPRGVDCSPPRAEYIAKGSETVESTHEAPLRKGQSNRHTRYICTGTGGTGIHMNIRFQVGPVA